MLSNELRIPQSHHKDIKNLKQSYNNDLFFAFGISLMILMTVAP
jgi:hypothetical protein